jgi:hypothetical protein
VSGQTARGTGRLKADRGFSTQAELIVYDKLHLCCGSACHLMRALFSYSMLCRAVLCCRSLGDEGVVQGASLLLTQCGVENLEHVTFAKRSDVCQCY